VFSFDQRRTATAALLAVVLALACALGGCATSKATGRMKVAATIVPLADFCRNVGGDLVEVQTLIPAGASAHVFEPTASQFVFVNQAKVFVMNGLNLESWATDVIKKVGGKDMVVVVTADAIPAGKLLKAGAFNGERGSPSEPYDPHVWLDPTLAMYQVNAIRDGFIKADPAHKAEYTSNAAMYKAKLAALDRRIAAATAGLKGKQFVALHPGWAYFSARYGVKQAAAVEEFPEQEPSGKQISDIIKEIQQKGIKVIFAEPQLSAKAAQVIAASVPGVKVYEIDPLGNPAKSAVSTYLKTMLHDISVMSEVLK
jgi:zinc transport system substrate-binding protein